MNNTQKIRDNCFKQLIDIYNCFELEDPVTGNFTQKTVPTEDMQKCIVDLGKLNQCIDMTIPEEHEGNNEL